MLTKLFFSLFLLGALAQRNPTIPGQHHANITFSSQSIPKGTPGSVWSDVIGNRWRLDTVITPGTVATQLQDIGTKGDGFLYFYISQNDTVVTCTPTRVWGPITVDQYEWVAAAQYNGSFHIDGKETDLWAGVDSVINEVWVATGTNTPVRYHSSFQGFFNQYDYQDFWVESPTDQTFIPPAACSKNEPIEIRSKSLSWEFINMLLQQRFITKALKGIY